MGLGTLEGMGLIGGRVARIRVIGGEHIGKFALERLWKLSAKF